VVAGQTLWAVEASGAGQPGRLLRATTADPRLSPVARVGTYTSGLAATRARVWVASPSSDPRDHAALADTVQEFDAVGHLLRTYPMPGASAVTADGDTAWVLASQDSGVVRVYRLSTGSVRLLATLGTAIVPPPSWNPLQLTGDGSLAVVVNNVAGAGTPARLWLLDAATGATRGRVDLPFTGWASVAVQGSRVLVAGSGSSQAGQAGGVVAVQDGKVTTLSGCPTDRAVTTAASAQQGWLVDTETGITWLVGAAGCAPGLLTQPATPLGSAATLAVQDQDAWVLIGGSLLHLTAANGTSPSPRASMSPTALASVCGPGDLTALETGGGSVASQPFSLITVTNAGDHPCTLSGYPTIVAVSSTPSESSTSPGAQPLAVVDGGLYEVPDPGPSEITLAPGGHAWFALGTGTGYAGTFVTVKEVRFATPSTPATGPTAIAVPVSLAATMPPDKPLTITVTAFAAGTHP
jgi:hypothetical protein